MYMWNDPYYNIKDIEPLKNNFLSFNIVREFYFGGAAVNMLKIKLIDDGIINFWNPFTIFS